jgi:hypothetical protein
MLPSKFSPNGLRYNVVGFLVVASVLYSPVGWADGNFLKKCVALTKRIVGLKTEAMPPASSRPSPADYAEHYLNQERQRLLQEIENESPVGVNYALQRLRWEAEFGAPFVSEFEEEVLRLKRPRVPKDHPEVGAVLVEVPPLGSAADSLLREANLVTALLEIVDIDSLSPEDLAQKVLVLVNLKKINNGGGNEGFVELRSIQDLRLLNVGFSPAEISDLRDKGLVENEESYRSRMAAYQEEQQLANVSRQLKEDARLIEERNRDIRREAARANELSLMEKARKVEDQITEEFGAQTVKDLSQLLSQFVQRSDATIMFDASSRDLFGGDRLVFQWFSPVASRVLLEKYESMLRQSPRDLEKVNREMQNFISEYLQQKNGGTRRSPYHLRSLARSVEAGIFLEVNPVEE